MPYIQMEKRAEIAQGRLPETPGELNYFFSVIVDAYAHARGEERYFVYNEIIGALECCKLELYRRMIGPYEDKSIERNGDVYNAWDEVLHAEAEEGTATA